MGALIFAISKGESTVLKKTITYKDYDDNERTEDFYFNLSKAELAEMELSTTGGLEKTIKKIVAEQDNAKVSALFKDLISRSYGEKTLDGKRFVKSKELSDAFMQTEAYVEMFLELIGTDGAAADFINSIVPQIAPAAITPVE